MIVNGKKKSRQKQESFLFILMGFILLGLMISGYFLFVDKILPEISDSKGSAGGGTGSVPRAAGGTNSATGAGVEETPGLLEGDGQIVTLFFPGKGKDCLMKEMRKIPAEKLLMDQAISLVRELLKGPMMADARPAFPMGTQLRSLFFVQGTFIVDFSSEFIDQHPGGASEEALTVYSLVNTLTELDKKSRVRILVNGEEKDSIKGHVNMRQPLTRYESLALNLNG